MAKVQDTQIVNATLFAQAPVFYNGVTLLSETDHSIKVKIKKPRTSTYYEQVFPRSQVLSVYGKVGEVGGTNVIIMEKSVQLGLPIVGTLEEANGEYFITDSGGYVARIAPKDGLNIVITAADSNPAPKAEKTEGGAPVPPAA